MSQVYVRSDQLKEKVFEVKLQINEWKVLFAIDGKMDSRALADFLEMDEAQVNATLQKLTGLSFVQSANGEATFEAEEADSPSAPEKVEEADLDFSTAEQADETTAAAHAQSAEGWEIDSDSEDVFEETEETFEDFWDADADIEESESEPAAEAPEQTTEAAPSEPAQTEFESADELDFDPNLTKDSEMPVDLDFSDEADREDAEEAGDSEDIDELIGNILEEEESLAGEHGGEAADTDFALPGAVEDEFDLDRIFDEDLDVETVEEVTETDLGDEEVAQDFFVPPTEAPVAAGEKPATILVVDDSVVIRKMVEIALENENYNIVSVATGKEALTYLDDNTPDLIILDIMLSDVNGLDVLKAIKASKDIPVVMLSAKDTPRETNKAKQLGADDFIPKPFKDEELVGKIRELIRH